MNLFNSYSKQYVWKCMHGLNIVLIFILCPDVSTRNHKLTINYTLIFSRQLITHLKMDYSLVAVKMFTLISGQLQSEECAKKQHRRGKNINCI